MQMIKPSIPKGMRDFLPEKMLKRKFVIDTIKTLFEKYGYEPLETPTIEKLEILSGKCGDEGDRLIFKILKRGTGIEKVGKDVPGFSITNYKDIVDYALRYDLTVPLSRVIAMYQNEIALPFKRYQIQPVWRADRPQKGRYREFYQCDTDIVGSKSMLADAEIITLINEVLTTLGFKQFKIRINNRKILSGIVEYAGVSLEKDIDVCIAIDKFEKIGIDGVKKELSGRDISETSIAKLLPIFDIKGDTETVFNDISGILQTSEIGKTGIEEIKELLSFVKDLGVPETNYMFDLILARGLNYYTGPIYESIIEEPKIGSLTGGGRYDELVGMFLGKNIPATGTSFGIERIIDVMTELDMLPETKTTTKVLVTIFNDDTRKESMAAVKKLRESGINSEIFIDAGSFKKQFKYANKKGIPYVITIGPEEIENKKVKLKDMTSGEQSNLSIDEVIGKLNNLEN